MDSTEFKDQPYHIVLARRVSGGGELTSWVATVVELPGCVAQGATRQEAAANIDGAMDAWFADCIERGAAIPMPAPDPAGLGEITLRLAATLHDRLLFEADQEGVSLVELIGGMLAGAVGWKKAPAEQLHPPAWNAELLGDLGGDWDGIAEALQSFQDLVAVEALELPSRKKKRKKSRKTLVVPEAQPE